MANEQDHPYMAFYSLACPPNVSSGTPHGLFRPFHIEGGRLPRTATASALHQNPFAFPPASRRAHDHHQVDGSDEESSSIISSVSSGPSLPDTDQDPLTTSISSSLLSYVICGRKKKQKRGCCSWPLFCFGAVVLFAAATACAWSFLRSLDYDSSRPVGEADEKLFFVRLF